MNRKEFEIWQRYKTKEQAMELQKLQQDFAARGLASSGMRNEAEKNLVEKYRTEIEMERETMEEEENETNQRHRERSNLIWTNRIIALGAIGSVVLALPIFSNQINNVQVKVDSLEASIRGIYASYTLETFCYDQLKDSYKIEGDKKYIELRLKNTPIPSSLSVWEGNDNVAPNRYQVIGNTIKLEVYLQDLAQLKMCCEDPKYHFDNKLYSVRYIPEQ